MSSMLSWRPFDHFASCRIFVRPITHFPLFPLLWRRTFFLLLNPLENIVVANRAVRKEAVYGILFVCEDLEYRIQLCDGHQAQMERWTKQFQGTAGRNNSCVTEDQGAQPVIVNL